LSMAAEPRFSGWWMSLAAIYPWLLPHHSLAMTLALVSSWSVEIYTMCMLKDIKASVHLLMKVLLGEMSRFGDRA
jgi:hypothetical protein